MKARLVAADATGATKTPAAPITASPTASERRLDDTLDDEDVVRRTGLVRQLLGHRNVQTTINAYVGLENIHASEIFSKIVLELMNDRLEAAE